MSVLVWIRVELLTLDNFQNLSLGKNAELLTPKNRKKFLIILLVGSLLMLKHMYLLQRLFKGSKISRTVRRKELTIKLLLILSSTMIVVTQCLLKTSWLHQQPSHLPILKKVPLTRFFKKSLIVLFFKEKGEWLWQLSDKRPKNLRRTSSWDFYGLPREEIVFFHSPILNNLAR